MANNEATPFSDKSDSYNKSINPVPVPEKEIGIDTNEYLFQNIINAGRADVINVGALESMTTIASGRDSLYKALETMADDPKLSAVLETYAEDATEYNDHGQIVWVESSDSDVASFVNFLLKTLCVDKNIYKWAYSLCKYGDLYLRLYRTSEYQDLIFDPPTDLRRSLVENLEDTIGKSDSKSEEDSLTESVKIKAYARNDRYVKYVEMVSNPAEMFELTRFGKTAGYVQAILPISTRKDETAQIVNTSGLYKYKFKQREVNLFPATEFVHACLEDNTSRTPEEVDIFIDNQSLIDEINRKNRYGDIDYYIRRQEETEFDSEKSEQSDFSGTSVSYKVKTGQSLLYSSYKIWKELSLLESSVLLSRVTQSSVVRLLQVNVGDMPKEQVGPHLQGVKTMIEQKVALNAGSYMSEYTNPGPIINAIYVPVRGEMGAITPQTIGGDYDPKSLVDLDYFLNNLYGNLRVPKQYFSQTDDSTGFNGGTSLSITSSRYAKAIKRIQNTLIQAITDVINLMLLDADLGNYINKFTIKMLPPTTQEEKDRRENLSTRIQLVRDVMDLMGDIDEPALKLEMLKGLLADAISNQEITKLLQGEIDKLKKEAKNAESETAEVEESDEFSSDTSADFDANEPLSLETPTNIENKSEPTMSSSEQPSDSGSTLPSPSDLGIDITDAE